MKRGEIAHSVSRGAFYLSMEKVAALISGLVYFALLLRWLGPTKYGIMALALSFTGLATMATGNFEVFLERYAAEYQANGAMRTLMRAHRLALALKVVFGVLAAGVLIALSPMLSSQFAAPELATLLPLLTLIVAFDGLSTTGRATLFGMQRFRSLFVVAVLFHAGKTVMVGALWATGSGLIELAFGLAALTLAQGVAMTAVPLWILRGARDPVGADSTKTTTRDLFRSMLAYCTPMFGARATWLAGQNVGKIILGKLFAPHLLGYFSFAFQVIERFVELAHTLPTALLPSLTQLVARKERDRMRNVFDQAFRLIQVVACGLSFLVFAFAREITLLVGSPLFEPAVPLLRIMALVPMVRTAQQPLTMLFQALRRPGTVLTLAVLKFIAEFGSYFVLVPWLGLNGAGWANVLGAAVSYVAALFLLARTLPEGARVRARAAGVSVGLLLPLLAVALLALEGMGGGLSLAVRLLLVPAGVLVVFATHLINRYDLEKLSSIPLRVALLRRLRDAVVEGADWLARVFERRSPA